MAEFVAAAIISALIALAVAPHYEAGTREGILGLLVVLTAGGGAIIGRWSRAWFSPSLNRQPSSWAQIFQACFTGLTLTLAVFAFSSWAGQEVAKRKSDTASEALKSLQQTVNCFFDKSFSYDKDISLDVIQSFLEWTEKGFSGCKGELATLNVSGKLVELVIDRDASYRLSEITEALDIALYRSTASETRAKTEALRQRWESVGKLSADEIEEVRRTMDRAGVLDLRDRRPFVARAEDNPYRRAGLFMNEVETELVAVMGFKKIAHKPYRPKP